MRVHALLLALAAIAASVAFTTEAAAQQAATGQARAIQGVNIRTGGGSGFPVVGTLKGGEIVGLAACDPYWCRLADGRGWVSRQYLAIGAQPAAVSRGSEDPAVAVRGPAIPAPFTGAWTVVPTPVETEVVQTEIVETDVNVGEDAMVEAPKKEVHPPFRLIIAQAGTIIEGIADGRRIEGKVAGDGREATFAMTAADGKRLDGRLTVDDGGNSLSGVILSEGAPILLWRAVRTTLTR